MGKLVNVFVGFVVIILIQTKASHNLLGQEVHDENTPISAANSYKGALDIEFDELGVDLLHDHGHIMGEDDLIMSIGICLQIHF